MGFFDDMIGGVEEGATEALKAAKAAAEAAAAEAAEAAKVAKAFAEMDVARAKAIKKEVTDGYISHEVNQPEAITKEFVHVTKVAKDIVHGLEFITTEIGEELAATMESLKDAVGEALALAKAKITELLEKYEPGLVKMALEVYKHMKPVVDVATELLKSLKQHPSSDEFVAALKAFALHSLQGTKSAKSTRLSQRVSTLPSSTSSGSISSVEDLMESFVSQCGDPPLIGSLIEEFKKNMEALEHPIDKGTFGIGVSVGGGFGVELGGSEAVCMGLDDVFNFVTPGLGFENKIKKTIKDSYVTIGGGVGLDFGAELDAGLDFILSTSAPSKMGGKGLDASVVVADLAGA